MPSSNTPANGPLNVSPTTAEIESNSQPAPA